MAHKDPEYGIARVNLFHGAPEKPAGPEVLGNNTRNFMDQVETYKRQYSDVMRQKKKTFAGEAFQSKRKVHESKGDLAEMYGRKKIRRKFGRKNKR